MRSGSFDGDIEALNQIRDEASRIALATDNAHIKTLAILLACLGGHMLLARAHGNLAEEIAKYIDDKEKELGTINVRLDL